MKMRILFSWVLITLTSFFANSQSLNMRVDSLVVSSIPWNTLSPKMGLNEGVIRGLNSHVIRDSVVINEFLGYVYEGLNIASDARFYLEPRVIVDIYFGKSFVTVSIDKNQRCKYLNRDTVSSNRQLFDWIQKYGVAYPFRGRVSD